MLSDAKDGLKLLDNAVNKNVSSSDFIHGFAIHSLAFHKPLDC